MLSPKLTADRLRRSRDRALEAAGQANRDGDEEREQQMLAKARRSEDQIRSLREGRGTKKEMCDV